MVDIAFLLLIFFMTTTTFKPPEEVTVELPSSTAIYKIPESNVLILTVSRDNNLYAQAENTGPVQQLQLNQLGMWVRQERSRNPRVRMIVKADKRCDYGTMEDVMNVLQEQRTNRFVLMTAGEGGGEAVDLPEEGEGEGEGEGEETTETDDGPAARPSQSEADGVLAQVDNSATQGRN
jgi:biopolymer transport protein ExbD